MHYIYKYLIYNHVKKLKDSKQDSLLLVYKHLNSAGPSCTILNVMAKVAVVYRYYTFYVNNAFLARNRVDTVSGTSLSLFKEGKLTVLHFKRDVTS